MAESEPFLFGRPKPFQKRDPIAFRNFLRAKCEGYSGQVVATSRPYYLIVDPSDACHLRCPTCPTGIENENRRQGLPLAPFRQKRALMSPALFDSVLDELGDYLFVILFYNFGEPLHNKRLPEFIRKAADRGIETEIHTHLSLTLADDYIESLLQSGLTSVNASIDGFSQETYEKHRVGGNFALVRSNLERIVHTRDRLGLSTAILYNFLIFSFNEHEIPDAAAYCQSLGIGFNPREAFLDDPSWLPSHRKDELPQPVPREVRFRSEVEVGWSPPLPMPPSVRGPSSCGWHYGYAVVQPGGQMAPCCAVPQEAYDMGTIDPGRSSFGDVWNGDSFRKARAHFAGDATERSNPASPLCTRCPWPPWLQQLYSVNDARVFAAFQQLSSGSDPAMVRAFDLLCELRYGLSAEAFGESPGIPRDYLFLRNESSEETATFVEFVRKHLPAGNGAVTA